MWVIIVAREKITREGIEYEVIYDDKQWIILENKRIEALKLMRCLQKRNIETLIHGSIARGDVDLKSDIDVVILNPISSYTVELTLDECKYQVFSRKIVMATPTHVPKAYLTLDPEELVQLSFPLARLRQREIEFYCFGGCLRLNDLEEGKRVPGVNKKLELIIPTPKGHIARSVIGVEDQVARLLNISVETVLERVRVLKRRNNLGRTGVYLEIEVPIEKTLEEVLLEISYKDQKVRKILEERG